MTYNPPVPDMTAVFKQVTRPALTVKVKHGNMEVNYDANAISYASHDGKYVLTFLSSGELRIVPISDVISITLASHGAHWCGQCDQALRAYPRNEPSHAASPSLFMKRSDFNWNGEPNASPFRIKLNPLPGTTVVPVPGTYVGPIL